ncbi:uncharacterized protein DFL_007837 [Arthrobotrys flagrans]|uniref:Coenzyme Q-binding protein COQ10 START domain-containing protein n=1 Tax=Arthrobotrys flagrans TaxID=97331 RepID=A0A436ZWT4_ARTFL|nr:hypothetical protein DFL_007837 [Arthrobotrys flagrans]
MIIRPPLSLSSRLISSSSSLLPRPPTNPFGTLLKPQTRIRTFILPTPSQRLTVSRHLRHPPSELFTLISDISSYSSFVPFCVKSTVTSTTPPPDSFPTTADLRVGWGGYDETFTSKVIENGIFEVLRARWVVNNKNKDKDGRDSGNGMVEMRKEWESKVDLEIEYKFANPLYAVMSEAVVPVVAGKIIEAFEGRVEEVLGKR